MYPGCVSFLLLWMKTASGPFYPVNKKGILQSGHQKYMTKKRRLKIMGVNNFKTFFVLIRRRLRFFSDLFFCFPWLINWKVLFSYTQPISQSGEQFRIWHCLAGFWLRGPGWSGLVFRGSLPSKWIPCKPQGSCSHFSNFMLFLFRFFFRWRGGFSSHSDGRGALDVQFTSSSCSVRKMSRLSDLLLLAVWTSAMRFKFFWM